MKRNAFNYSIIFLLILCLATSLFLTSCGEETAEDPGTTDVVPNEPTDDPTDEPSDDPTDEPSDDPTDEPTDDPIDEPTDEPTDDPADNPDNEPTDDTTEDSPDDPSIDVPSIDEPDVENPTEQPDIPDDIVPEVPKPDVNPIVPDNIGNGTNESESTSIQQSLIKATAKGLRSAVSIYCNFTKTSYYYPWDSETTTQEYSTTGAGVIYTLESDGSAFVVTNFHVVYDASSDSQNHISEEITVFLYGMESSNYAIPATYVGGSANYDIAVLRIDKSEVLKDAEERGVCTAVSVADSDLLVPGETTIAIGNPAANTVSGISVTQGIVSVASEYIDMNAVDNSGTVSFRVIRTDTAVNPGNSGGGLFNMDGELVGIVNAKITTSTIDNIGYAIPSKVVGAVAGNIIDNCYGTEYETVRRATLGISVGVTELFTEYDEEQGIITITETVIASEVVAGGVAEGKLQSGDEIKVVRIGQRAVTVTRAYHLIDFVLNARVGDEITFDIIREGKEMSVSLTVTSDCIKEY